jgi:hypothetical protein
VTLSEKAFIAMLPGNALTCHNAVHVNLEVYSEFSRQSSHETNLSCESVRLNGKSVRFCSVTLNSLKELTARCQDNTTHSYAHTKYHVFEWTSWFKPRNMFQCLQIRKQQILQNLVMKAEIFSRTIMWLTPTLLLSQGLSPSSISAEGHVYASWVTFRNLYY